MPTYNGDTSALKPNNQCNNRSLYDPTASHQIVPYHNSKYQLLPYGQPAVPLYHSRSSIAPGHRRSSPYPGTNPGKGTALKNQLAPVVITQSENMTAVPAPPLTPTTNQKLSQAIADIFKSFEAEQKRLSIPKDPRSWSCCQIQQWIHWAIDNFNLEGVDVGKFTCSGYEILEQGRENFLGMAPPYVGDILWEHLEILQKEIEKSITCSNGNYLKEQFSHLTSFEDTNDLFLDDLYLSTNQKTALSLQPECIPSPTSPNSSDCSFSSNGTIIGHQQQQQQISLSNKAYSMMPSCQSLGPAYNNNNNSMDELLNNNNNNVNNNILAYNSGLTAHTEFYPEYCYAKKKKVPTATLR